MSHEVIEKRFPSGALASHAMVAGDPTSPALILLHGAGPGASASSNWRYCIGDLAERFFVVAPDMIGFGQSEIPDPMPTNALAWTGLRVQATLGLMDHFEIQKAHILGNSMGGAVTLHLLLEAPERFGNVMMMGAIGAPFTRTPELIRLLTFYNDPRLPRFRELMHSFVYDPALVPGLEEMIVERFKVATDPAVRKVQEAMIESMKNGFDSLIVPPSALARLPHKMLAVHGRQDRVVPLETSLYFLQHMKNCELYVLDRCGHWAQTQRWDAMLPLIKSHFLGIGAA